MPVLGLSGHTYCLQLSLSALINIDCVLVVFVLAASNVAVGFSVDLLFSCVGLSLSKRPPGPGRTGSQRSY